MGLRRLHHPYQPKPPNLIHVDDGLEHPRGLTEYQPTQLPARLRIPPVSALPQHNLHQFLYLPLQLLLQLLPNHVVDAL